MGVMVSPSRKVVLSSSGPALTRSMVLSCKQSMVVVGSMVCWFVGLL